MPLVAAFRFKSHDPEYRPMSTGTSMNQSFAHFFFTLLLLKSLRIRFWCKSCISHTRITHLFILILCDYSCEVGLCVNNTRESVRKHRFRELWSFWLSTNYTRASLDRFQYLPCGSVWPWMLDRILWKFILKRMWTSCKKKSEFVWFFFALLTVITLLTRFSDRHQASCYERLFSSNVIKWLLQLIFFYYYYL